VRDKGRTSRTVFSSAWTPKERAPTTLNASVPPTLTRPRPRCFWRRRRSPRAAQTGACRHARSIVAPVGRIRDLEVAGVDRKLAVLRPHDLRHTFAFRLSAASGTTGLHSYL
jgi:integrase